MKSQITVLSTVIPIIIHNSTTSCSTNSMLTMDKRDGKSTEGTGTDTGGVGNVSDTYPTTATRMVRTNGKIPLKIPVYSVLFSTLSVLHT